MQISQINTPNSNYMINSSNNKNQLHHSIKSGSSLDEKSNKNDVLKSLMKEKEKLADSKSAIMESGLKNGEDPLSIKKKVEEIDKQIEEIDKQINNLQLEDKRKALGSEDKDKDKDKKSNHTSNSISDKDSEKSSMTNNLLDVFGDLSKTKNIYSQKKLMEGNAKVLEDEIKTDEKRGHDPVRKKKNLSELKSKINDLGENLGKELTDVNTKIKDNIKESENKSKNLKQYKKNSNNDDENPGDQIDTTA